jgi:acetaldehyde dehydrogenase (acetylating)
MSNSGARVAVLGTGNIGADLGERLLSDHDLQLVAVVGRRSDSPGLIRFEGRVPFVLSGGINSLLEIAGEFDGVFDGTSAHDHVHHWQELQKAGKWVIDLTPSRLGQPMVPALVGQLEAMALHQESCWNYSMISCGGQSSAVILHAICKNATGIEEVEISSSIAALSAGPATRANIDEYIDTTENLARIVSGCEKTKSILVLNPAEPPIMMRTTVHVKARHFDLDRISVLTHQLVKHIQRYVPGYDLVLEPYLTSEGHVTATAKVTGAGYVLPEYAGNLDIINSAAVETARLHLRSLL